MFRRRRGGLAFGSEGRRQSDELAKGDGRRKEGRRTLRYSMNRFKNATKCSAFRMFPGIASWIRSSERTIIASRESLISLWFEGEGRGRRSRGTRLTRIREQIVLLRSLLGTLQTFHQFRILVLKLLSVRFLHPVCTRARDSIRTPDLDAKGRKRLTPRSSLPTWSHSSQQRPVLVSSGRPRGIRCRRYLSSHPKREG